jgi:hypothetical protein
MFITLKLYFNVYIRSVCESSNSTDPSNLVQFCMLYPISKAILVFRIKIFQKIT